MKSFKKKKKKARSDFENLYIFYYVNHLKELRVRVLELQRHFLFWY